MRSLVVAVIAVLLTASACSVSHSPVAKTHAKAVDQKVTTARRQVPPLQKAGAFCADGISKDLMDGARDAVISSALNNVDPTGGEAVAWQLAGFEGDQVTVQKELASGQILSGTFDLGQLIYAILGAAGDVAGKYDQKLALQWKLFGLIGPAAVYCAEAAFWLDGTVGGQIGTYLRKPCVFLYPNQVDCTSVSPEITLEGENEGDTSGCTFSGQISWGDGSQQTVQYQGADGVPSFVASHTYSQHRTFSISFTPTVVSGECSTINGSYIFTYE
jgi:hypothetical protein